MRSIYHFLKPINILLILLVIITGLVILIPVFDDSVMTDINSLPGSGKESEDNYFQNEWMQEWALWLMLIFFIPILIFFRFLSRGSQKLRDRKFLEFTTALSKNIEKGRTSEREESFKLKLLKKHPHLSAYDLELIAFLVQHPSSKEIAAKLNISASSVNTARYRLRKKLDLQKGEDLVSYLLKFEN